MNNWRSRYLIYTDGSYCKDVPNEVHGGIVFCDPDTKKMYSCAHVMTKDRMFTKSWNIGGECVAAYLALFSQIVELKEAGFTAEADPVEIEMIYDYEGVGKWITREFKNANSDVAKWYRRMVDSLLASNPNIRVKWTWVKSHASTSGNNMADKIASYTMDGAKDFNASIFCFDDENGNFRFK